VKFLGLEADCKVIQLTSPIAAEGKTLTAMNLAVALAQAGDRVIVVGCDLRRPRLDTISHAAAGPGLTSVLVGDAELHDAIVRHESVELDILRTGPIPPDPSELLGSDRTSALIRALRTAYDVVILDCPPLLPVSDSLILARYADATLVVVSEGKTSRRNLARALELLRQVDAPLKGTILNGTGGASGGYGYGYGYGGYGYGGYSYAYAQENGDGNGRGRRLPGWRKGGKKADDESVLVDS
jgi:capsular exopolysaccharide synthesis family protein